METIAVHYHELALKGRNRGRFEKVLRDNMRRALAGLEPFRIRPVASRILVEAGGDPGKTAERLRNVFGVAHVMRIRRLPRDLDAVGDAILEGFSARRPATFRVSARRDDKSFPQNSTEIDRIVGARVHMATGIPVKLRGAEVEAHVIVLPDEILLGLDKREGAGGLPVGTGGRVLVLMSGGIDSPVAAWRMMRRGCRADLCHFHSWPLVDRTTQEKARDLAEALTRWQFTTRLHLVPLAQVQSEVRLKAPEPLRIVLYRRFMLRIAERIARDRRCLALVTGESLGQVASQTLENLATVDAVASLPVLRPLIGTDKREIVAEAERIGTYPISIRPDQDCCTLFVPRHVATRSRREQVEEAEQALDVEALVADAAGRAETVRFGEEP